MAAQSFLDRLPTVNTGITGSVTYEGLTLRIFGFDDTSPNLSNGTKLELLNKNMIQTDDGFSLWCAKVKVLDGPYKNKVGFVYASLTTFGNYADYSQGIINAPSNSGSSGGSFIDKLSTQNTGTTGQVTYEGLTLRMKSFDDVSPNLKMGTKLELLNTNMVQTDDGLGLWCAKVKVMEGDHKGKVGYVYASLTTFGDYADYTSGKLSCPKGFIADKSSSSSSSSSSGSFLDQLSTVNTGCTGLITFEGLLLKTSNWEDGLSLAKGTKIELLSNKMIRSTDSWALNHIKVKVLTGTYTGKVGYVYPSSTTFTKYSDYTNQSMYPPKGFTGDDSSGSTSGSSSSSTTTENTGSWDLPTFPTERTGISGTVNIATGAYAYEDDGQWLTEVKLPENSTFSLLNKQVFHDAMNDDFYIKVKVTYDPTNTYTNKVMYITILDTNLSTRFDQTGLKVN